MQDAQLLVNPEGEEGGAEAILGYVISIINMCVYIYVYMYVRTHVCVCVCRGICHTSYDISVKHLLGGVWNEPACI